MITGLEKYVFVYLDDFLIFSKTMSEHIEHLRNILKRLNSFGFFINDEKCILGRKSVKFLGKVISCEGIEAQ